MFYQNLLSRRNFLYQFREKMENTRLNQTTSLGPFRCHNCVNIHTSGLHMFSSPSLGRHLSLIFLFIVFLLRHYVVSPSIPPHRWVTTSAHKASCTERQCTLSCSCFSMMLAQITFKLSNRQNMLVINFHGMRLEQFRESRSAYLERKAIYLNFLEITEHISLLVNY